MLDAADVREIEQRCRRYQGAWTGSAGAVAAGAILLIRDREKLLEENRRMSEQIAAAIDTKGPIHDPEDQEVEDRIPHDWILRGERELKRDKTEPSLSGDSLGGEGSPPAEKLLLDTVDVIRSRRATYGPPGAGHFAKTVNMVNALFADKLREPLTQADWAQIMILDKLARYQGPSKTADGPTDIAGYAACLAEVEATSPPAPARPR